MAENAATMETSPRKSFSDKMLDGIEKLGNKVPHPVLMFLYLIIIIIILSHILYLMGVSVTDQIAEPVPIGVQRDYYEDTTGLDMLVPQEEAGYADTDYKIQEVTIAVNSLLTVEGIRFIFSSFVNNFAGFAVVAVTLVAMAGVGAAESAGMMGALIRQLVRVAPRRLIVFILVFVGALSSIA